MKFNTRRWDDEPLAPGLCSGGLVDSIFGGGPSAPAPDPLIGQAAADNAQVGKDYLAWMKEIYAGTQGQRDEATRIALDQARTQTETARKQNELADESAAYAKTFRPAEQKLLADALAYDTPQRRDAEAAQAVADVGTASEAAQANMNRSLAARGVDPSSGNALALGNTLAAQTAAAQAAAGNTARKNVEAVGAAKLADAAGLGRGIVANNATQTQIGLQAGNSAVNNAQVPGAVAAQGAGMVGQGVNTAIQGNSSAGNLMLGQFNGQQSAYRADQEAQAGMWQGLGNVAGLWLGKK